MDADYNYLFFTAYTVQYLCRITGMIQEIYIIVTNQQQTTATDRNQQTGDILDFFSFLYCIQHCFICSPADSIVSMDAGIEPMTVSTSALAVRRNH